MDHVVHINNGSGAAKPIVLRLLPGEETIFNLKVLNDGEPSNISLQASSPVFKSVRLKKPDHYVILEEVVPILARMPADKKRLDGEILLTSGSGEKRVPITLLRDSEDPGDDLEDPGLQGDEELRDYEADEEDDDLDPADRLITGRDRDDADDESIDDDDDDDGYGHESIRRRKGGNEEDDGDDEGEETEKEPRRLSFSRERDLERYRSARKRKAAGTAEGREDGPMQRPARSRAGRHRAAALGGNDDDAVTDVTDVPDDNSDRIVPIEDRFRSRIDDRFVDPSNRQDGIPRFVTRKVPFVQPEERKEGQDERDELKTGEWAEERRDERPDEGQVAGREVWQEQRREERTDERMRPSSDYDNRFRSPGQGFDSLAREAPISSSEADTESYERIPEDPEAYSERDDGSQSDYLDRLGDIEGMGSIKVVPAILFLALVIVLVMTFITMNIPEFPGALASSILIVTLIIYGAATLLKA